MTKNEFQERLIIALSAYSPVEYSPKMLEKMGLPERTINYIYFAQYLSDEMEEGGHEFKEDPPPLYYMPGRGTPKV